MMYPILCKVRYESLHELFAHRGLWKQIAFSVFVNWVVAPFLMVSIPLLSRTSKCQTRNPTADFPLFKLGLAWAFLPDKSELRVGLILVGLGRCIAMVLLPSSLYPKNIPGVTSANMSTSQVLIWTGLAGGDGEYCAILVAVNSILQMVLFAPLAVFFIRIISHENRALDISYSIVATSVAVFLGIPLGAAVVTRFALRALTSPAWYERVFLRVVAPWSLIGLLYTILVLFASQGHAVVHQIVSVVRVAAPLVVYFVLVFFLTLWATKTLGFGYALATTQSFTAASNNFELAIAVAVATFGPDSDQALASTVGPLVEVPVLLGLVYLVRWIGNRWEWKN